MTTTHYHSTTGMASHVRTGPDKVFALAFQPGNEINPDDSRLITAGYKHGWKRSGQSQISPRKRLETSLVH